VTVIDGPRIDFDHHSPDYRDNWERMAAALHAHDYPIARSEHHGGFWVIGSWKAFTASRRTGRPSPRTMTPGMSGLVRAAWSSRRRPIR